MELDWSYFTEVLGGLLGVDSPSGFTAGVMAEIERVAAAEGSVMERNAKGCGIIRLPGREPGVIGVSAHTDTLGLMVRGINADGTLAFTQIGSPILPTLDGEYCRIYTRGGKVYTGTILCASCSAHVHPDSRTRERDENGMLVRLDERAEDAEAVKALGIRAGDYICYDPKTVILDNGFIKSRFLDDKLSVAILLAALRYMRVKVVTPRRDVMFLFSVYEEVGHGMRSLPDGVSELLAVDMGCIGSGLDCTEYDVSICAKDSYGPYDYEMTGRLAELAKRHGIAYAVDVYPMYGSDASAALRGGNNIRAGLIGPGVHASHGMERSHRLAAENTFRLLMAYLTE